MGTTLELPVCWMAFEKVALAEPMPNSMATMSGETSDHVAATTPDGPATLGPERKWLVPAAVLALLFCGFAAYSDSLDGGFVFDDEPDIVNNPSVHHIWPIWRAALVQDGAGQHLNPRLVVAYSFALNYAWAGLSPWRYHVVNLAIHLLAGLTLFGFVRRTLLLPSMQRYAGAATGLAFATALLWMVHPLNTQAVTYIVQRFESLMGLFYLLTMYCAARAMTAERPLGWAAASVECCLLALGSKEVAVSAPIMVLLYDRAFVSGSFREAWRRRQTYYIALFAMLLLFVRFYKAYSGGEGRWAGSGLMVSWYEYAASQPGVILHYLRLAFWPSGQRLDYAWPVAQTFGKIVPPALVVGALVAMALWCTIKRPKLGFLGAWFFLILAPTSSVMPIIDLAFEHRMYLSLAAVVAAVVFAAHALIEQLAPAVTSGQTRIALQSGFLIAISLALGVATYERNRVWQSDLTVWTDNVAKAPGSTRAHGNLGVALLNAHQIPAAKKELEESIRLAPSNIDARANLGTAQMQEHDFVAARKTLEETVALDPNSVIAQHALATVLMQLGEPTLAEEHFRVAVDLAPSNSKLHYNYGCLLLGSGRTQRAIDQMEKAIELNPEYVIAHFRLGCVLADQGDFDEACEHWRTVLRLDPRHAEAHLYLAVVFDRQGRREQAIDEVRECLRLAPKNQLAQQVLSRLTTGSSPPAAPAQQSQ